MKKNIRFKISDITSKKDAVSKFSIQYSAKNIDNTQVSYEIISALKAENNIIIEVNSSFLNLSESESKVLLSGLIEDLDDCGVLYKKRKILVQNRRSMLSISLKSELIEGFELFAIIPDVIWRNEKFRRIIPNNGVRYYFPKLENEINLDEFIDLSEDEKITLCTMVIFDYILSGSMGINTCMINKADVQALINKI